MQYIYKINSHADGFRQFDVEADSYHLSDGFFTFTERNGANNSRPVASVDARQVFNVERTAKS